MGDGDSGETHRPDLRTFGRRRGRKPSERQERLLRDVLPRVAVDLSSPPPADPATLFGGPVQAGLDDESGEGKPLAMQGLKPAEVWLEIGFGGAEHLLWQAEHHPCAGLIGCEPFEDGVVKALSGIVERRLPNVRLHADDARPLLRWLPEASVARAFVLFPDPWPKKKHIKRRLVSRETLALLARVLRPGGELRIGTDIGDYARTILLAMAAEPRFAWTATSPQDWRERPADWPGTRYEAKAVREGRRRYFLRFERV